MTSSTAASSIAALFRLLQGCLIYCGTAEVEEGADAFWVVLYGPYTNGKHFSFPNCATKNQRCVWNKNQALISNHLIANKLVMVFYQHSYVDGGCVFWQANRNHLFDVFTSFFLHKKKKDEKYIKRGSKVSDTVHFGR